jgi:hypothetical protein
MNAVMDRPGTRWNGLYADRLGWAYRAYQRFVMALSPEVREHLVGGDGANEPYVAVYGKTQVGKTTLLLELMEVRDSAQAGISEVLRGRRDYGRSATATAMEYRRSPDNDWHLDAGVGPVVYNDDEAMCDALCVLRQAMSERKLLSDAPVVVSIPSDRFQRPAGSGTNVRMLDLPGDNPTDEVERAHVARMAERYVPHADLILLVGRADDLSFLDPAALALPGIEDWQYVPNRFRIVTTYSFTPQSVQQYARQLDGSPDPARFRERLLDQIDTFGLALVPEAREPHRFFPLEFGQSWQAMLDVDQDFAARVAPVVAQVRAELHADIRASANEASRFRNACDIHIVARRQQEAGVKLAQATMERVARELAQAKAGYRVSTKGAQEAEKRAAAARARLAEREHVETMLAQVASINVDEQISLVDGLGTNTAYLYGRMSDFEEWLRKAFLALEPDGKARAFFGQSSPDMLGQVIALNRIVEDAFSSMRSRMSSYWRAEYYPSMSSSFAEDTSELRDEIRACASRAGKLAHNDWTKQFTLRLAQLQTEANAADSERTALDQVAKSLVEQQQSLTNQLAQTRNDLDALNTRLNQDSVLAQRFRTTLDQEYVTELRARRAALAASTSPLDSLSILLSIALLQEERRKIQPT